MGRRSRYSIEQKLHMIEEYISGRQSPSELHAVYGMGKNTLWKWSHIYQREGLLGLKSKDRNASYTKVFKERVVLEYLSGVDSFQGLSVKYGIPAQGTIHTWVKQYNSHKELKDYDPKGAVFMTQSRKTTFEERLEIVRYCLDHQRAYKLAAEHYDVAYAQVYQWVKKYRATGEAGLKDRRGHRKDLEELSELERLKRENERLRHQLELKERESILLKKVKEFERRRYSPKPNKNRNI